MDDVKLTKRQKQVLDYIQYCIAEKHCPPSVREIGEALGLSSPSTVQAHLDALEAKGLIKREGSKSRALTLTDSARSRPHTPAQHSSSAGRQQSEDSLVHLPLVGRVAAGTPILADQNIEEEVPLPIALFGDQGSFLLTVHGESMIEAGIFDGDVLLVKEQQYADNGDIVVAMIADEATVKAFYKERDCIRLQPRNEAMEPIYTRNAQIIGIVTGLFRTL